MATKRKKKDTKLIPCPEWNEDSKCVLPSWESKKCGKNYCKILPHVENKNII